MEKQEIQKQARQIMDDFAKALEKVKVSPKKEKKKVGGFREEGEGLEAEPDFRKRFFANAPKTEGDFIIAEKKSW